MRKLKVIALMLIVVFKLNAAETILLDFETTEVSSTIASWMNYSKKGETASTWGEPNPKTDNTNTSNNCYKIEKSSDDPYWTGLEVTLSNTISITNENSYLHVLVYKNTNSRIALTYTPENGNQSADTWQLNTTTDSWIDYVLSIPVGTKLKTLSIKIADDAGDYYFDQIMLSESGSALSRTVIGIDPSTEKQVIEGWGASLCWWANMMGGFSEAKIKTICDWITDPDELNMNIFRFNIGGGDAPLHNHMRGDGGNMPGYKLAADTEYDWTQDENQRKILQQLISSRIEQVGENDIQIVGFSNSPPYWMTRSGCSAGSTEGNVTNLKSDMFDDFADYLTDVASYYHDKLGITFDYLEPFNEPDETWWKANGGQEGCYFSVSDQVKMIKELYAKLEQKEMLSYCHISANDANTIDHAYSALQVYKNEEGLVDMFDLVSTHSYGGDKRALLANWTKNYNKKLWQSESGPLYVGTGYESQIMIVADRIITDLKEMECTAWCDWQIGGGGSNLSNSWAMIVSNYDDNFNPITRNTNYYIRAQFSRYLKPGYTVIESSANNSIAAVSPDNKELVLVISNSASYTQKYTVDLSKFVDFGKVHLFRTRAVESFGVKNSEERLTVTNNSLSYDALSESVTTFVIPINQFETGLFEIEPEQKSLYFSGNTLYTKFTDVSYVAATVYNLAGMQVVRKQQIPANGESNLNLKEGIYLVKIENNFNKIVEKIIVTN